MSRLMQALAATLSIAALAGPAQAKASTTGTAATDALTVHASFSPATIGFADTLGAEIDVAYGAGVSRASILVTPSFAPFVETGAPTVKAGASGGRSVLSYHYTLQCVSDGCLPTRAERLVHLPPARVTALAPGGKLVATAAWPALTVVSRLSQSAVSGPVVFRHQKTLPAPAYGVSPTTAVVAALSVAALAAVSGIGLIGRELRRALRRRKEAPAPSLLERALLYTRDSARRADPADRRRALELLAEAVSGEGEPALADRVRRTAWVAAPPTPARSIELADEVEGSRPA